MPFDGISRDPVIETLVGAKAIIQQYGWLQRKSGEVGGPRCVVGAIMQMAFKQKIMDASAWPVYAGRAIKAYAGAIGGAFSAETNVMNWQDRPERTVVEVLAGFDKAVEVRLRMIAAPVSAN